MSESSLRSQFPGTPAALARVAQVVRAYRQAAVRDPSGLELEVRVGRAAGRGIETGVTSAMVGRIMQKVGTNHAIQTDDWAETQDVFHTHEGVRLRSRTSYDTYALCPVTSTVSKKRVADCVLQSGPWAIRVALSRETPCDDPPQVVRSSYVRLQRRRRARFASARMDRPTWMIECGVGWSGATRREAETRQMANDGAQHSIEIELLDPAYVAQHTDEFVACSAVLKASDAIDEDGGVYFDCC